MSFRILHVTQSSNPRHGGPIEGIRQQACSHAKSGDIVEIVSLDSPDSEYLKESAIPIYPLRIAFYDYFVPLNLYKWLKANHTCYDAVIINGIWGLHLLTCWLVLAKSKTPFFVFTHGMLDPWFRKRYPLKHIKKSFFWIWAVYPVLRSADAVFFTCEEERILARQSFWPYTCNEAVIDFGTEGIPDPNFDYSSSFLSMHSELKQKLLFLYLGRVAPKKGPDLLIRAVHQLQAEGLWDSSIMSLVLAGPADSSFAKYISRLASKLNVSNSIHWTGMISGVEKWGAFQSAEAFLLSSHQENFGIAVVEALSCGCPVLISPSVNIANEILTDNAGLVQPDTLAGVVQLFKLWFSMTSFKKESMKSSARACFQSRFHISLTTASIIRNIRLGLASRS